MNAEAWNLYSAGRPGGELLLAVPSRQSVFDQVEAGLTSESGRSMESPATSQPRSTFTRLGATPYRDGSEILADSNCYGQFGSTYPPPVK